jgi:hypothetical protein
MSTEPRQTRQPCGRNMAANPMWLCTAVDERAATVLVCGVGLPAHDVLVPTRLTRTDFRSG